MPRPSRRVARWKCGAELSESFRLLYDSLNVLNEFRLVNSEYNSWFDYRMCVCLPGNLSPGRPLTPSFRFQGKNWVLVADADWDFDQEFRVSGVALTRQAESWQGL